VWLIVACLLFYIVVAAEVADVLPEVLVVEYAVVCVAAVVSDAVAYVVVLDAVAGECVVVAVPGVVVHDVAGTFMDKQDLCLTPWQMTVRNRPMSGTDMHKQLGQHKVLIVVQTSYCD
jgi:hypothetical protein